MFYVCMLQCLSWMSEARKARQCMTADNDSDSDNDSSRGSDNDSDSDSDSDTATATRKIAY